MSLLTLRRLASLALLGAAAAPAAADAPAPLPVLLVVAQQDFYAPDYAPLRASLEAAGVPVAVAAPSLATAWPHGSAPEQAVQPDVAIADADPADYSAVVFVGGWGAASVSPAFPGTTFHSPYRTDAATAGAVNALVGGALHEGRRVGAICFGVSALAWTRVDGVSPLAGRSAVGYAGGGPGFTLDGVDHADAAVPTSWHVAANGGEWLPSGSVGDPLTSADDVVFDGPVVTAEDFHAAPELGRRLAEAIHGDLALPSPSQRRALLVIANQDFWWREYAEPRAALLARGIGVDVAAGVETTCFPHADSGYADGVGAVEPDMSVAEALAAAQDDPGRWDAIVFVGGWGASSYQFAFEGTYANGAYDGSPDVRQDVNDLVATFQAQDKWVTALCHGVSVLAYARSGGASVLAGRTVVAWPWQSPVEVAPGGSTFQRTTREHVELNGATMLPTHSVGDPFDATDDVVVDGRIITGESFDAATRFGEVVADAILNN